MPFFEEEEEDERAHEMVYRDLAEMDVQPDRPNPGPMRTATALRAIKRRNRRIRSRVQGTALSVYAEGAD